MMNSTKFDILILGGGLVGLTAANLCAREGFSVAVVERQKPNLEWNENHFDFRCSAISRASQRIFQKIGVWDRIKELRVSPYRQMVVWDALGFGEIIFDAAIVSEPDLGHIIENRRMIKTLWEVSQEKPGITFFISKNPTALKIVSDQVILELDHPITLEATVMVGADGAHSWVRKMMGIETINRDYHQKALVATVTTELPHQETAWQRFLPEGPLAFLPLLPLNTSSIVWTATPEKIEMLLELEEEKFCQELAHHFDYRLGKVLSVLDRKSFLLERLHAKQYIHDRVVLMGDAAHVIHPLAGQGVNLGLRDAEKFTEVITNARKNNNDIGNHLVLRKYERSRKSQVTALIIITEFLNKTFGSSAPGVLGARNIGLHFVNNTKLLKKKFIVEAMGI